jgi:Putative beta barrel porin-7 (BBP7)
MNYRLRNLLATAGIALAALLEGAFAQENLPFGPSNYDHDMQLFAPLELDLDNSLEDQYSGYFFEYNKLFWSYSGERVAVGSPNVTQFAEVIYRDNFFDEGDPPPPHQIRNTLEDVPPKAGFAFGNRYELGYQDNGHGWLIGILDGPELNQSEFYGFARVDTNGDGIPDGLPPFIEPDYTPGDDVGPGTGPIAGGDLRAFGFGAVPVLFETPPGYLLGFRDYLNNLAGAQIGTQGGPFLYVGNYGASTEDNDPAFDFFRLADDLDEDGFTGGGLIDINGDGIIDLVFVDFDDLHEFNIFFDNVLIRNSTETNGVELMWSHALSNKHYQAKNQNNHLVLSYGARFLEVYDQFRVDAEGSILGDSFWDTSFTNSIVGPQVALKWVNQRQRWRLQANGRFMFGYNTADWDQFGLVGERLIPGALNAPLYARPTAFAHGLVEREFSPVAELRLQAAYQVTTSLAIKAGYTGSYVGNIRRAAPSVRYFLPDMGYVDTDGEDLLINGFDLGVEFIH